MNLARNDLKRVLLHLREEATNLATQSFPYPGPMRSLRSKVTTPHLLENVPITKEGVVEIGEKMLEYSPMDSESTCSVRRGLGNSLVALYLDTDDREQLGRGIIQLRIARQSPALDQNDRESANRDLFHALSLRYSEHPDINLQGDLEEVIQLTRELWEATTEPDHKEDLRKELYNLELSRFNQCHESAAIEAALAIMRDTDPHYALVLNNFAQLRYAMYKETHNTVYLEESFEAGQQSLLLWSDDPLSSRARCFVRLALQLYEIKQPSLTVADMTMGIDWCKEAVEVQDLDMHTRQEAFTALSSFLSERFAALQDLQDISDAICASKAALDLTDPTENHYLVMLAVLYACLLNRAKAQNFVHAREDLVGALSTSEECVQRCPSDDPRYLACLCDLGNIHHRCFLYKVTDPNQHLLDALRILTLADEISVEGENEHRSDILSALSAVLSSLYETHNDESYLDRCLEVQYEGLALAGSSSPRLAHYWYHLAGSLRLKYVTTVDANLLYEALDFLKRALDATKFSAAMQLDISRDLCGIYHTLFSRTHQVQDIKFAIQHGRYGLNFPVSPRSTSRLLDSLSNAYNARFEFEGEESDLDESIELLRRATIDRDDPIVSRYLAALAGRLRQRSLSNTASLDNTDSDEALAHCQAALDLCTLGEYDYRYALSTMSLIQHERFVFHAEEDMIDKAISSANSALPLKSPNLDDTGTILHHLARMHFSKYRRSREEGDLIECIEFDKAALEQSPETSLRLPAILFHLGFALYWQLQDFDTPNQDAIKEYLSALLELPIVRPLSQVKALDLLARLSINKKDWSTAYEHLSAAIKLFPMLSPRAFTTDAQQHTIEALSGIPEMAACCALFIGKNPEEALAILEAGRGIMSGWIINTRNDISRLETVDPELAARYVFLRDQVSNGIDAQSLGPEIISSLRPQDQWRSCLYELEEIERKVQSEYPGLESFQKALSVEDIKKLAEKIPIVEINSTEFRSDAFVVSAASVTSIPLPSETRDRMENITKVIFGPGRKQRTLPGAVYATNKALRDDLAWLYSNVVSPILSALHISPDPNTNQRLVWVTSGLSSFCPLHAADLFSEDRSQCTISHVISSYIPSMKALQFARESEFRMELAGQGEILVASMTKTKGQEDISADEEEQHIYSSFNSLVSDSVNVLRYPSRNNVLEGLRACTIAHFSCHGSPDGMDPSKSCILLEDSETPGVPDKLTARDISASKHDSAMLCFLAACSTAENTAMRLVDENIHVASAFQLSGFSHVVGTLWEARNRAAVQIAQTFYGELARSVGKTGSSSETLSGNDKIAKALHLAVKSVKETKRAGSRLNPRMDVLSWAPFIHLGP